MMTDPIADMLTRIRNAIMARQRQVLVPSSNMKVAIARILKQEGFVRHFDVGSQIPQPVLRIILKYDDKRDPVVHGLKRVSKPSRRVYCGVEDLPRPMDGLGIAVVSTSKGVLSDRECRQQNVGGEVLCTVC